MPHTLNESFDLSGEGVYISTSEAGMYFYFDITTRGAQVGEADPGSVPTRLTRVGWVALGHANPDTGVQHFGPSFWIEFDHQSLNLYGPDHLEAGDVGWTSLAYKMIAGSVVHVDVYSFS